MTKELLKEHLSTSDLMNILIVYLKNLLKKKRVVTIMSLEIYIKR